MAKDKTPLEVLTVRLPAEVIERLPPPSLTGERAEFIRAAIKEKIAKEERKAAREAARA